MARSLNKVTLIGNLTRDPELRYTPAGTAVCTIGLATNRQWKTDTGDKKEDVEFHRIVAWNKLAELCAQLLAKGRKVFIEGRLQTRKWTGQDGNERTTTEIVISDMIILDSRFTSSGGGDDFNVPDPGDDLNDLPDKKDTEADKKAPAKKDKESPKKTTSAKDEGKNKKSLDTPDDSTDDDIPF